MPLKHSDLIYDWNTVPGAEFKPAGRVLLNDESLRDGLQSPSVKDPPIGKKIEILHLMESLGINSLNLGLPGAGPRAVADVERLAREIVDSKIRNAAAQLAATKLHDVKMRSLDGLLQTLEAVEIASFDCEVLDHDGR